MKKVLLTTLATLTLLPLASCLGGDEPDYTVWRLKNETFFTEKEAEIKDGQPVYSRLTPSWAPGAFSLIKWETDRAATQKNLMPMDNSLCKVKYDVDDIEGNRIDDSYSSTTYGDSIYQCRPNQNIIGFWSALTQMHVGDSVTCIMPAIAAYGENGYGSIKPYTTLVYHIKLVSIPAYEIPM